MPLHQLDPNWPDQPFPELEQALTEPDGLLAIGGCLSAQRLVNAYRKGIFPWYNPGEPILWWSPDPRLVLFPEQVKISHSLHKTLKKQLFEIHYDLAFEKVMQACAAPRSEQSGTWINQSMLNAYQDLHRLGIAHSIEAWQNGELVGGLYGLAIGQVFFGESMFHRRTDASKVAFIALTKQLHRWGFKLIDCQISSPHLISLGAETISRKQFASLLNQFCYQPDAWQS